MQINLKQPEIITALKQYIGNNGINLDNKDVQVTFTAGRKESGISAELNIGEKGTLKALTKPVKGSKGAKAASEDNEDETTVDTPESSPESSPEAPEGSQPTPGADTAPGVPGKALFG
ncbi:MAG: hypothetical protein E6R03_08910 [Hyphomicrobiaceae bacterium]|nr:MAG: hypothetical protein E6R03_08910 [Hyphomicrobiaceae bacterium]